MSEKLEKRDIAKKKISEFLKMRDKEGNSLLHYAVQSDDQEFVKKLIAAGCNVNEMNGHRFSPLLLAIQENQPEMAKVLLDAGADYDYNNFYFKQGPLHLAAHYICPEIVKLLIQSGADVNAPDNTGFTPLHMACIKVNDFYDYNSDHRYEVIEQLIKAGANVDTVDFDYWTPLSHAAYYGFHAEFELMLQAKPDMHFDKDMTFTLLGAVARGSSDKILTRLIELGFDINMTGNSGRSCLHIAAVYGQHKIVQCLFDNGAVIKVDANGKDPLCAALENWCEEYRFHDFHDDHDEEIEKLYEMEYSGHSKTLDLLLKHGSDINHVTNNDSPITTPLYIVVDNYKRLHSNFLSTLLKKGAKLDFDHPSVLEVINESNGSKFPHLLLRHQAMFEEIQNSTNGPINFNVDRLNLESRDYFARCRAELELMRETKLGDTNATFLKLLVNRDIGPYARNESIKNAFDPEFVSSKFPIYGDLVVERFSHEVKSQILINAATNGLAYVMKWDRNSNVLLLAKIVNYLDKKDLTNLSLI